MHDVFSGVAEIEQVFLSNDGDSGLGALIVVDQKDYAALRRIFELETDIIKALPDTRITFDVVIRDGRSLGDVVSPRGRLLYQR